MNQIVRNRLRFDKLFNANALKKLMNTENRTKTSAENVTKLQSTYESYRSNVTRNECISSQSNMIDLFSLSDKIRQKHTEYSSDIIHGFAEFQAIIHQINCLNILCGEHYQSIEISKIFNGCFLYNMYVTLKDRPNINYYIEKFILTNAPNLFGVFQTMIEILQPFIDCLATESISKRKKRRNMNKKRSREQKKNAQRTDKEVAAAAAAAANDNAITDPNSDSEFEDLNNKFSCLMKM